MVLVAAVVREGSFTRAAKQLGVSKQSVSLRVSKLEEALGVRLLERTTRSLRPTEAGARYVERCAAIAADIDAANHDVQQTQVEPSGLLRMSSPYLFGRRFLMPVVAAFMKRWPKVSVDLALSDRKVDLLEEGIDVAIRIGPLDDSSLATRRIGAARIHVVASPAFLTRHGRPTARTVSALPSVGMRPSETWTVGAVEVKVTPRLVVNDLELVCDAAMAGVGLAQVPELVCAQALKAGKLVALFEDGGAPVRPVMAVMPSRRFVAPKVRLFVDALAAAPGVLGLEGGPRAVRRSR